LIRAVAVGHTFKLFKQFKHAAPCSLWLWLAVADLASGMFEHAGSEVAESDVGSDMFEHAGFGVAESDGAPCMLPTLSPAPSLSLSLSLTRVALGLTAARCRNRYHVDRRGGRDEITR
jgi:hypothetical protein